MNGEHPFPHEPISLEVWPRRYPDSALRRGPGDIRFSIQAECFAMRVGAGNLWGEVGNGVIRNRSSAAIEHLPCWATRSSLRSSRSFVKTSKLSIIGFITNSSLLTVSLPKLAPLVYLKVGFDRPRLCIRTQYMSVNTTM
jgi:hypothetical protein